MNVEANFLVEAAKAKLKEIEVQLSKEMVQTHNRKDIAGLYTKLLDEWLREEKEKCNDDINFSLRGLPLTEEEHMVFKEKEKRTFEHLIKKYTEETTVGDDDAKVEEWNRLFAEIFEEKTNEKLALKVHNFCVETLDQVVTSEEIKNAACSLIRGREFALEDKLLLNRIIDNEDENCKLVSEFCSVVHIMLKNFENWTWNEELTGEMVHFHRACKFRLMVNESIVTAMFLEVLGKRLANFIRGDAMPIFDLLYTHAKADNLKKYESKAFKGTEMATCCYDELHSFFKDSCEHLQAREAWVNEFHNDKNDYDDDDEDYEDEDYEDGDYADTEIMEKGGMLISTLVKFDRNLDIAFHRKDNKLVILKSDLKDFGVSVNHNFLLALLKKLGFNEKWVKFFKEYLSGWSANVPKYNAKFKPNGKGTLFAHTLSDAINELVLMCVDLKQFKNQSPIFRINDDFTLLASEKTINDSWECVVKTLALVGLEPNMDKTSYVILDQHKKEATDANANINETVINVNENMKAEVEAERKKNCNFFDLENITNGGKLLKWQGLELNTYGQWNVQKDLFNQLLIPIRNTFLNKDGKGHSISLFSMTNHFNNQIKAFRKALGPISISFGVQHLPLISETMTKAEKFLCGGLTIEELLKREIQDRYPETELKIPKGWFYWPVSAGGLYCEHATIRSQTEEIEFTKGDNSEQKMSLFKTQAPPSKKLEQYWIAKDYYGYSFDSYMEQYCYLKESNAYGKRELEKSEMELVKMMEHPRYNVLTLDEFQKCKKYVIEKERYLTHVLRYYLKSNYRKEGDDGTKFQIYSDLDKPTRKLIEKFCGRTTEFKSFGGHATNGLKNYTVYVCAQFGHDLNETFGSLGLIAADLVPHNLLTRIREEKPPRILV